MLSEVVDLRNMRSKLKEANNALEFFLIGIVQEFGIRPKQAAALMTHNNAYLVHVLIRGL